MYLIIVVYSFLDDLRANQIKVVLVLFKKLNILVEIFEPHIHQIDQILFKFLIVRLI